MRPMTRLALAATLGLLATMTACTEPDDGSPAPPSSLAASPAYTGKWSKLETACPALTTATMAELKITGTGTPSAADASTDFGQNINCSWGEGEGYVAVSLQTYLSDGPLPADKLAARDFQEKVDKSVGTGEIVHSVPDAGFQDKAYLAVFKDQATLQLWTLSSNVKVTVYRTGPRLEKAAWDGALRDNKATLEKITLEVLDDLG
jgi:hypothetical protein